MNTNILRVHSLGLGTLALCATMLVADDLPTNNRPRAIHGDTVQPDWSQSMTITVGPEKADLVGTTDKAIQAGVDYVARRGGGTIHVLPGTYRLRNSIFLASKVRLLGSGPETVLFKEPSATTALTVDGDHWDQEVTLADPKGFQVGDGVRLVAQDPHGKGTNMIQRTLIAAQGNRFKLDQRLTERFHLSGEPKIATNFALLQCTGLEDVVIENLTVDGNKAQNVMLDNGRFDDGAIRIDESNHVTVRGVTVREFYCDGIVWGISHDVLVENCHLYNGARLALHSGSGSQRSIVRGNKVQRSGEGVYFCWGAQHGLYEKNLIEDCGYGMTFGHSDSDNLIRDNDIRRSAEAAIYYRGNGGAFGPHRNRFEGNRIVDSGGENGVAIDIQGEIESVALRKNEIRETRGPGSRIGIRFSAETRDVQHEGNVIEGLAKPIVDQRKPAAEAPVKTSSATREGETVRVAGVVLKWLRGDKEANYRRIEPMIREAAAKGAKIVCTTETFLDGYAINDRSLSPERYRALGEPIPSGPYFRKLADLAKELDIHLVAGMQEAEGETCFNTAVIIGPKGELIGKYHKQQLEHEAARNTAGKQSPVFETRFGKMGVMICADRRSPEVVQGFATAGADFLLCLSGGMSGPKDNDPILQARSKENRKFIVFVHPKEFLVTGPEGDILARTLLGESKVIAPEQAGTEADSRGLFYFDLPLKK